MLIRIDVVLADSLAIDTKLHHQSQYNYLNTIYVKHLFRVFDSAYIQSQFCNKCISFQPSHFFIRNKSGRDEITRMFSSTIQVTCGVSPERGIRRTVIYVHLHLRRTKTFTVFHVSSTTELAPIHPFVLIYCQASVRHHQYTVRFPIKGPNQKIYCNNNFPQ